MNPKVFFITGGCGFIGSNFVRYLLEKKDVKLVINLDKLTYAGNTSNLKEFDSDSRYVFIKGDIIDSKIVRRIFQNHNPECLVHFAAESHVDRSIDGPSEFVNTNIFGTFTLLQESLRYHKLLSKKSEMEFRFHHISTDEVFGSLGKTGSFSETTPYDPSSPYSAAKASSDHLARAWHRTFGLPVLITNCSNNYGPYQFPEKLIPLMINNARQDKSLPVYGGGLNIRDWIHVKDHCRALERVIMEGQPGRNYNIGSDQEKQNLDVIYQILEILGKSRDLIQFVTDRPGHDRRYAIDATLLRRELGWEPSILLEEGLAQTIQWYTQNTEWVEDVRSGSYSSYYQKMYEDRDKTLNSL